MTTSTVALRAKLASVLFACSVPALRAQVIHRVNPQSQYVETFVQDPSVSGNLLVGLAWMPANESSLPKAEAKFNAKEVGVFLSPALQNRKACVEVSSQDGRYFAQNLYQLPDSQGPEVFAADTNYRTQLHRYSLSEMAVSIRLVDDCNSAERGFLVPARMINKETDGLLVAYVNADAQRLKVSLRRKGAAGTIEGKCVDGPNDAVKISFSSACTFNTPAPEDYDLTVQVQERFTSRDFVFKVSLRQE